MYVYIYIFLITNTYLDLGRPFCLKSPKLRSRTMAGVECLLFLQPAMWKNLASSPHVQLSPEMYFTLDIILLQNYTTEVKVLVFPFRYRGTEKRNEIM